MARSRSKARTCPRTPKPARPSQRHKGTLATPCRSVAAGVPPARPLLLQPARLTLQRLVRDVLLFPTLQFHCFQRRRGLRLFFAPAPALAKDNVFPNGLHDECFFVLGPAL